MLHNFLFIDELTLDELIYLEMVSQTEAEEVLDELGYTINYLEYYDEDDDCYCYLVRDF